jgi:hypothetical protein
VQPRNWGPDKTPEELDFSCVTRRERLTLASSVLAAQLCWPLAILYLPHIMVKNILSAQYLRCRSCLTYCLGQAMIPDLYINHAFAASDGMVAPPQLGRPPKTPEELDFSTSRRE